MRRRAVRRLLGLSLGGAAAAAAPCAAQVESHLDAALAYVKYDGYVGSAAAALTPSLTWRSRYTTAGARGTLLLFESGNTSLQALLTASTFSPSAGAGRVEIAAEGGGSDYAAVAQFLHALGHARVHLMGSRWGVWTGGLAGVIASKVAASGASGVSAGGWARSSAGALEVTWTHVAVGAVAYGDLQGRGRWRVGHFDLEAVAGTRGQSRASGSGVYGSASVAVRLGPATDLVFAGGSYASDPVRGTIPGRFVTVGARLALRTGAPLAVTRRAAGVPAGGAGSRRLADVRIAVERLDGQSVLVVTVTGAHRVEVMGDFTGWQPVVLAAAGEGRYRYAAGLPSGLQRFNLRLDGGPWGVPEGAALAADDFGGGVGVLVVP